MSQFQKSVDKIVETEREALQRQQQENIEKMIAEGAISPMTECAYGQSIADLETNKK